MRKSSTLAKTSGPSPAFSRWLGRALQFDEPTAFDSPHSAQIGFEEVLAEDTRYVTRGEAPADRAAYHSRYGTSFWRVIGTKPLLDAG